LRNKTGQLKAFDMKGTEIVSAAGNTRHDEWTQMLHRHGDNCLAAWTTMLQGMHKNDTTRAAWQGHQRPQATEGK